MAIMASITADAAAHVWGAARFDAGRRGGSHFIHRGLLSWWQEHVARAKPDERDSGGPKNDYNFKSRAKGPSTWTSLEDSVWV